MGLDIQSVQSRFAKSPFLHWPGLPFVEILPPKVKLCLPWRDEFIATPELGGINGGLIATMLDGTDRDHVHNTGRFDLNDDTGRKQ